MQDKSDDADELKARLARLANDLQAQRGAVDDETARKAEADLTDKGLGQAMSLGFRVLSEFVAGTVVGAVLGWQLDAWLGTSPVFLILFLGLGVAAGFWNVYRLAVGPQGRRGR
ncbi:AtpZ/AtpI family protein [Rhodoblastus sp.]|jgi:ATP synthase protein I|uniref:AtpZ/AtpI family protein n=1 Tax=Rhodoblastus sp. TaxID=1962975 RepID=UPI00260874F7|nr:AtpZ/AtpI family protein [Rhodoblastus sp.]